MNVLGYAKLLSCKISQDSQIVAGTRMIIKILGYQHQWSAGGYGLEIGHLRGG